MSKNLEEFEKKVKAALEKSSKPAVGIQGQVMAQRLLDIAKRKGTKPSPPRPSA